MKVEIPILVKVIEDLVDLYPLLGVRRFKVKILENTLKNVVLGLSMLARANNISYSLFQDRNGWWFRVRRGVACGWFGRGIYLRKV